MRASQSRTLRSPSSNECQKSRSAASRQSKRGARGQWHTEAGRHEFIRGGVRRECLTSNRPENTSERCSPQGDPVRRRADSPPPAVRRVCSIVRHLGSPPLGIGVMPQKIHRGAALRWSIARELRVEAGTYFKKRGSSNDSFRLSIQYTVRPNRADRMEIAFALPCFFSSRAT